MKAIYGAVNRQHI